MRQTVLRWVLVMTAFAVAASLLLYVNALATHGSPIHEGPFKAGGLRSFEIVPLETVSEASSNASIGDLNGDGHPDIVLVKGRHWPVTSVIFFGDWQGTLHAGTGATE
jgi:hypothetical protein